MPAMGEPEFFSAEVARARRFYRELTPNRTRPLTVVSGGLEYCTPGYAINRKTFPYYSIEYVARGSGRLVLGGRQFPLEAGTVFAYGPGVAQDISGDPQSPLVKYFVDFSGHGALKLLKSCRLAAGQQARVHPPNALAGFFEELIQAGLHRSGKQSELCAKLLECVVLKIAQARNPVKGGETPAFVTYQQCRRHIEQHFLRLGTLDQIAGDCHADKAYLCRLFRRFDSQSPYQYLLRMKMNHAAERLQKTGTLVKQVAEETGFADPFHFSRVFRNVMGLSPSAFRDLRQ